LVRRVLDSRKLVVEKPYPKLLAEQVKLLLRKRKKKKTTTHILRAAEEAIVKEVCS